MACRPSTVQAQPRGAGEAYVANACGGQPKASGASATVLPTSGEPEPVTTDAAVAAGRATTAADAAAFAKLREASIRLRGVDVDPNDAWAQKMIESGTAADPAFYALLEEAAATITSAYQVHHGRSPTKREMAAWLPFAPSMEANGRVWEANAERLKKRSDLDHVAAREITQSAKPAADVTNADIAAFVRANLDDPNAIANAMAQYGVSIRTLQAATGFTSDEIAAYIASSGNATLQRILAEHQKPTTKPKASTSASA